MANQIKLKIITPEKTVLEEMVDSVTIPTTLGEIGIFPNHIPLVAALSSGDIVGKKNGEDIPMAVSGGFIEVKNNEVAILADFAELVSDISDEAVEKAKARAEELIKMKNDASIVDFEHFEAELARSLTRVKIADKWRNKKYRA
ncbi:MAG: ATP synthase F1 subunit epsilon [Candidatus Pacebacteria bacterium]|nr:ATP synthase F1 subunit epsilon [Candidatus Paceibacterota bacterium]